MSKKTHKQLADKILAFDRKYPCLISTQKMSAILDTIPDLELAHAVMDNFCIMVEGDKIADPIGDYVRKHPERFDEESLLHLSDVKLGMEKATAYLDKPDDCNRMDEDLHQIIQEDIRQIVFDHFEWLAPLVELVENNTKIKDEDEDSTN